MAFGAEDVQATGLLDLLTRGPHLHVKPGLQLGNPRLELGGPLGQTSRTGLDLGHVLGVATQFDVDPATRHVRGDRDRAGDAGVRDDL